MPERFRRQSLIVVVEAVVIIPLLTVIVATAVPDRWGDYVLGLLSGAMVVIGLLYYGVWRGRL